MTVGIGNLEVHIAIIAQLNLKLASVTSTQETSQIMGFSVMANNNQGAPGLQDRESHLMLENVCSNGHLTNLCQALYSFL